MSVTEKRRRGRGLDALLGISNDHDGDQTGLAQVPLDQIEKNPYQPRKDFDPGQMAALKESLTTHGLLQPLVVRSTGSGYQLVAGERRRQAAREAGWAEIPVRVVDLNDQQVFEAALVENLQRADLNPIEKAQGFAEYVQRYDVKHDELARRMGLDRSTVSNLIRLLELPPSVQEAVRVGQISNGHARALLALGDADQQVLLCNEIIAKGLTVRAIEEMARVDLPEQGTLSKTPVKKTRHVQAIEEELKQSLMTRVEIRLKGRERGRIVIAFENNDDFERIVHLLRGEPAMSEGPQ